MQVPEQYLERLVALGATRFQRDVFIAARAVGRAVLRLQLCMAIRAGYRHDDS